MKYNCKFILEKRKNQIGDIITESVPIFVDLTYAGQRLRYFTGYRVNADKWDLAKHQVNKNAFGMKGEIAIKFNEINSDLDEIRGKASELLSKSSIAPNKKEIIQAFDTVLCKAEMPVAVEDTMPVIFDKYINSITVSESRRNQLTSNFNNLVRFSAKTGTALSFETWSADTLVAFEKYLRADAVDPEEYKHIKKNRPEVKGTNSIVTIMKRTRTFFNWALKNGYASSYPFINYEMPKETYGRPIFLTKAERDKLFNAEISNSRLAKVRDIFVFQCLVGCRVGDLVKLSRSNIQGGVLTYIAEKTKSDVAETRSIPLSKKARDILSRYNEPDGSLLPFISDQRYNEYIRELFELVELDRIVTRLNSKTGETEHLPLYKVASSHMARRTFVGILYKKVKDDVIGSMSGHVKGSKAFARYYDIDDEMKQEAINLLD